MTLANSIDPTLQALIKELKTDGIGKKIYSEVRKIVKFAIIGGRYPEMYSPTGRWDDEAYDTLTDDFVVEKLLKNSYIAYLLQTNKAMSTFRKSVENVFKKFLISNKKKTALDHLFRRTNNILHQDKRFKCFSTTGNKAHAFWGLSSWDKPKVFDGREEDLVRIGLEVCEMPIIEYEPNAKKISHILPDKDLAEFLFALFTAINSMVNLSQMVIVFKYKFNLLEVIEESLEDPVFSDDDNDFTISDTVGSCDPQFKTREIDEAAKEALGLLTPRQKKVLMEFQEPDANLSNIGARLECSKSTVDNELRRIMSTVEKVAENREYAGAIYNKIIKIIHDN
jgi:hypothetical protein